MQVIKNTVSILILSLLFQMAGHAQCDNSLLTSAREKLKGAMFIKDFKIRLQKGSKGKLPPTVTSSIYLNKGSHYRITLSNSSENKTFAVATLTDEFTTYGTSYDSETDVNFEVIDFYCKKTQVYFLSFYFKDGKEGCAASMLGLVETFGPE